jgi:predicted nucleic acid-binding protein
VTRYLVDTNVISATAPSTAVRRPALVEWMDSHSSDLFLSAITIAEIADGIAKAKREGAKRKASGLSAWLKTVLHLYADRVLPFDSRQLRSLAPCLTSRAAVVILRGLPISPSLRRLVGTS